MTVESSNRPSPDNGWDWPRSDYSRIPSVLYHDPEIYRLEQEKIFRGPVWCFLGLEAEIPNTGDFRTSSIGDTPVVYNRDNNGEVHAFVNRCAHRGALVRREVCGNATGHTCIYHHWRYDLEGNLKSVAFRHGIGGKGGMPKAFKLAEHGLKRLRVEVLNGVIFASFVDPPESLRDYLGPFFCDHIARTFHSPVRILGYQRQIIRGNWKLYAENIRDLYHGSLLHQFQGTFVSRITTVGGTRSDRRHRHNMNYALPGRDNPNAAANSGDEDYVVHASKQLLDPSILTTVPEFPDEYGSTICALFPNATVQQIRNSLAARQIRPRSVDEFELFWTLFGYQSDDEAMTHHRLRQANLVGPGGYVSLEDGEAIEIAHAATRPGPPSHSIVEMGGVGALQEHLESRINELPIRGFWSYYSALMGIEPPDGVR